MKDIPSTSLKRFDSPELTVEGMVSVSNHSGFLVVILGQFKTKNESGRKQKR